MSSLLRQIFAEVLFEVTDLDFNNCSGNLFQVDAARNGKRLAQLRLTGRYCFKRMLHPLLEKVAVSRPASDVGGLAKIYRK